MSFPYISQIHVKDCYAYQNLYIPHQPLTEMKHIIITGKNGSGKTTILKNLYQIYKTISNSRVPGVVGSAVAEVQFEKLLENSEFELFRATGKIHDEDKQNLQSYIDVVRPSFTHNEFNAIGRAKPFLLAYAKDARKYEQVGVETVTQMDDLEIDLTEEGSNQANQKFMQYLVNKKVFEAFEIIKNGDYGALKTKSLFDALTNSLKEMFEDKGLLLEFDHSKLQFYLKYSDGRRATFKQLPAGFSAFTSIVLDLLVKVDFIRGEHFDDTLDPPGIVFIDEPELHFHLSMQYQVLPLITRLFPNIQLIVATHSPAVISSIKNAVVYDLSSQQEVTDTVLGSSFSELMVTHFGLDNEFSPLADKIIDEIRKAVNNRDKSQLTNILVENDKYLTPSLRLEIESQIRKINTAA